MTPVIRIFSALCCVVVCGAAYGNCDALLQRHLASDMALDQKRFDQGDSTGFRVLAQARCFAEAEQLILAYITTNNNQSSNLWWHAAQMAARGGRLVAASQHARRALDAEPAKDDPFLWNDYVLGSIAFFERDRAGLQRHRDVIAERGMALWANRMNLNMLDTMLENFDLSYDEIGAKAVQRWKTKTQTQN
ncbi:MAG: hypothetical protein ACK54C_02870 [Betaproteobacteria bacterium]